MPPLPGRQPRPLPLQPRTHHRTRSKSTRFRTGACCSGPAPAANSWRGRGRAPTPKSPCMARSCARRSPSASTTRPTIGWNRSTSSRCPRTQPSTVWMCWSGIDTFAAKSTKRIWRRNSMKPRPKPGTPPRSSSASAPGSFAATWPMFHHQPKSWCASRIKRTHTRKVIAGAWPFRPRSCPSTISRQAQTRTTEIRRGSRGRSGRNTMPSRI